MRAEYEKEIAEDAMNIVFEADRPCLQDAIVHAVAKRTPINISYRVYECF